MLNFFLTSSIVLDILFSLYKNFSLNDVPGTTFIYLHQHPYTYIMATDRVCGKQFR